MALGIYQLYRLLRQDAFRERRWQFFLRNMQPMDATRILDLGGYPCNWESVPILSPITFLNTEYPPGWQVNSGRFRSEIGNGCAMPFADQSFDIVYSNSVIEHVGSFEDQRRFSAEINRVGKRVFLQTPNRWFFLEPHFLAPFVHWLPWPMAKRLIQHVSLRGLMRSGDNKDLKALADELRFVRKAELRRFFPNAAIHHERWLGMTKSFIAMGPALAPSASNEGQYRPREASPLDEHSPAR
ncbi:MAG TPA: methyltransferase domain-containing protein [Verrucomicrobiae bacterium]|nr:methyltransferase domain-containing protein [Verrucomicrobiae bacterium]